MDSAPFQPYSRQVSKAQDPKSWVFFVVSKINGLHRPVAVVSNTAGIQSNDSLRGWPLVTACQRVVAIFSDSRNQVAVRAELLLAEEFYRRLDGSKIYPEPVELPDLNPSLYDQPERQNRPWYGGHLIEFPFTMACLVQGIGFDARTGFIYTARPEHINAVYRDNSLHWGMVVVDITNLSAVSYGIVGWPTAQFQDVSNRKMERYYDHIRNLRPGEFEKGEVNLVDAVRPRKAMSAKEYMQKFEHYEPVQPSFSAITRILETIPAIDSSAMDAIWPSSGSEHSTDVSEVRSETNQHSLADAPCSSWKPDLPILDNELYEIRTTVEKLQETLRTKLLRNRLSKTVDAGKLLRSAFLSENHLELVQFQELSLEALRGALDDSDGKKVRSLSLCIESIRSLRSTELVSTLSRTTSLQHLLILQSPFKASEALSETLLHELATQPNLLQRTKVTFAGAYSAALRRKSWLRETVLLPATHRVFFQTFPMQQLVVSTTRRLDEPPEIQHVNLVDALLKPERFVTGFLLYLKSFPFHAWDRNRESSLFSLSSAPAHLNEDPLLSAEISPIPSQAFAKFAETRMDDLIPGVWTALICCRAELKYAIVRAKDRRISIKSFEPDHLSADEIEVVGVKEFLTITAPNVDSAIVQRTMDDSSLPDLMDYEEVIDRLDDICCAIE